MLRRPAGFTLLELLVAMGIFAIIGAMALGGLNAVVGQSMLAGEQTDRLSRLQRTVRLMTNDLGSLQPRVVRDERSDNLSRSIDPDNQPLVSNQLDYDIRGTRGGWRNPAGLPFRGTLQRFEYRVEDGKLYRKYWPVVDHLLLQEPRSEELMSGVRSLRFWYYDAQNERFDRWPPLRATAKPGDRPKGIQFILELEDWGEIERWVEVAR